jgi:hypothetical protein
VFTAKVAENAETEQEKAPDTVQFSNLGVLRGKKRRNFQKEVKTWQ